LIPRIPAAQRFAVKPDLDASSAQRFRDALSGCCILRCVAQKYGT
jgi:hypothetical protein